MAGSRVAALRPSAASLGPDDWESLRGLAGLRVLVLEQGVAADAEAGYGKAVAIMELDELLRRLEGWPANGSG